MPGLPSSTMRFSGQRLFWQPRTERERTGFLMAVCGGPGSRQSILAEQNDEAVLSRNVGRTSTATRCGIAVAAMTTARQELAWWGRDNVGAPARATGCRCDSNKCRVPPLARVASGAMLEITRARTTRKRPIKKSLPLEASNHRTIRTSGHCDKY